MTREKLIKKGKKLKRKVEILSKLKPSKITGTERLVDTSHGKIRVLEYGFDSPEISPLFVDLHGGGFILLSADFDEPMNLMFREKTNVKIISIDYPKAPESPYPIAIEAIYEVVQHYVDNAAKYGIDAGSIGIGGHSAGGNFAAVLSIRANERNDFKFHYQVLDFPSLDLAKGAENKNYPKGSIPPKMAAIFSACYIDRKDASSPYASPVLATKEQLTGLPPVLLILAGGDSLHDEGLVYAKLLREAGVSVELHDFPDSAHGFTYKKNPEAQKAQKLMTDFINRHK